MKQKRSMIILIVIVIVLAVIGYFYFQSSPYFSPRTAVSTINVNKCTQLATQCITLAGECQAAKDKCNKLDESGADINEVADCWSGNAERGIKGADEICEEERSVCEQFNSQCVKQLKLISNRII